MAESAPIRDHPTQDPARDAGFLTALSGCQCGPGCGCGCQSGGSCQCGGSCG